MNYEGVCIEVPATYTGSVKKQIDRSKILVTLELAKSATNAKFPHVRTRRLKHMLFLKLKEVKQINHVIYASMFYCLCFQ